LSELRGIIAGLDGELLNRVHAGLRHRLSVDQLVRRILAFDTQRLRIARKSIEADAVVGPEVASGKQLHSGIGIPKPVLSGSGTDAKHWKVIHTFRGHVVA